MPRKRKRVDSQKSASRQLDRATRDGVEQGFKKKFTYSPVTYRSFTPQFSKSKSSSHTNSPELKSSSHINSPELKSSSNNNSPESKASHHTNYPELTGNLSAGEVREKEIKIPIEAANRCPGGLGDSTARSVVSGTSGDTKAAEHRAGREVSPDSVVKEVPAPSSCTTNSRSVCSTHPELSTGNSSSVCVVELESDPCKDADKKGSMDMEQDKDLNTTDINERMELGTIRQTDESEPDASSAKVETKRDVDLSRASAEVECGKNMETSIAKDETEHEDTGLSEDLDVEIWQDKDLQQLKDDLNQLKDLLSDKDVIEWHKHTGFTNMAGNIVNDLRQVFHVELCTQAWSKFFEVLSSYPILPLEAEAITTVHLCEAPGAFITTLNHFLVLKAYTGLWQWLGATLSPYYEGNDLVQMVDDDRFIRSTLDNWYFGQDGTGDIMDWDNVQGLVERARVMGGVQLVTADGSIDCQNRPSEQEVVVSHLHHCEVLTALHILSPGGALVIKLFTMFESSTVSLMYLLCTQFEEVHVYKPVTSKGGNSEVYAVCCGFRKCMEEEILTNLSRHFFANDVRGDVPIFRREDIPESFLKEHFLCCQYFAGCQSDTIRTNIALYESFTESHRVQMEILQEYCTEVFVSMYSMKTIPGYLKITDQYHRKRKSAFEIESCTGKSLVKQTPCFDRLMERMHTGSFRQRMEANELPWKQRVASIEKLDIIDNRLYLMCNNLLHPAEINHWTLSKGRPLHCINSSRFCDGKHVKKLNTVLEHAQVTTHRKQSSVNIYEEVTNAIMNLIMSLEATPARVLVKDAEAPLRDLLLSTLPPEYVCDEMVKSPTQAGCQVIVLSVVDSSLAPGTEELRSRRKLLNECIHVLKTLPEGGHLVLHLYTSLTFFTTGLLYIMSRMFNKVTQCPHLPGISLQQVLYFQEFSDLHPSLLTYLEHLEVEVTEATTSDVLEVLPKSIIINDYTFTRFVVNLNKHLVSQFTNTVLDLETSSLTATGTSSNASSEGS